MMKRLFIAMTVFALSMSAESTATKGGCILSQKGSIAVGWEAFKTPAKKGVSGVFDTIKYSPIKNEGKNFKEILVGSTIDIDTNSIDSKNKGRDAKLVAKFFKLFSSEQIRAKVTDIKATSKQGTKPKTGTIFVDITMNGITKNVPMSYSYDKGVMQAKGYIDLFDFQAQKALASINQACFDKHQGKTWNDVAINFTMPISADLCNTQIKK